ncbi:MAG TPA: polymer-forming cytoskeletal protein [Polyangiaceae bacterium]|jgi:hypothetical protein|nr:polymer-forming cytoskeletal protein [Polyangiaceae bacterium]
MAISFATSLRNGVTLSSLALGTIVACSSSAGDGVDEISQPVQLASASFALTLQTPAQVALVDVAVAGTADVEVDAQSRVEGAGTSHAIVTNTGTAALTIGDSARVGDIYSKSKVILDRGAHLTGSLFALSVDKYPGARVDGTTTAPANLDPLQVTQLTVQFPATNAPSFVLREYHTHALAPGRFGSVNAYGHLVLGSGSYYFDTLDISAGGSLDLEQHDGPTLVFVKDKLELNGATHRLTQQGDLAIVVVGDHDVVVAQGFRGVIAAPNARLLLGFSHDLKPTHGEWGIWPWSKTNHSDDHDSRNQAHGDYGDDKNNGNEAHGGYGDGKSNGSGIHSKQETSDLFQGAFYAKGVHLAAGNEVLYEPPNALTPVLYPPSTNLQQCADAIRAPADLTGTERDIAYQSAIGRFCSMTGATECTVELSGRLNVEFAKIAGDLLSGTTSPAQFLALVRDRSRKRRAAANDPQLAAALCGGKDADHDWIIDSQDKCPHTPDLTATDDNGCTDSTLPDAPSAASVKSVLSNMNFMYSPACEHADVMPKLPAGTFWHPSDPSLGVYILSGRVQGQPPGCSVVYLFDIEELDASGAVVRGYSVAYWDSEELTSLFGLALPVPPAFIQFNPLPTDPATRGILGSDGNSTLRFRVQAMNGAGMRSEWSEWKVATNSDCPPLGVKCGN